MNRRLEQFLLFRIRMFQDEKAFRRLLDENGSSLQRFLHFKLPTPNDVDDAYSTISLRVWEYAKRSEVEHFTALMYTIARGVVAEFYRSKKRKTEVEMERAELVEETKHGTKQQLADSVDAQLLKESLDRLKDEEREVIILRYFEDWPIKKIANQIGKSENATTVMIHRTIKKLRALLEQ